MKIEPPSTNGSQTAPGNMHGAVVLPVRPAARAVTVFPEALPAGGPNAWLFLLGRGAFLGIALQRVVIFIVGILAIGLVLLRVPGGGWPALFLLGALGIVLIARSFAARSNYVHFVADVARAPFVEAAPLPTREKLPVYIWGRLEVEGKVGRFAALPGFYRTFASREHAIIGLAASRSWLGISTLIDLEEGLWYAFCAPEDLQEVCTGSIRWGGVRYSALALQRCTARTNANGRIKKRIETLYLATSDSSTRDRILADLAVDGAWAGTPDNQRTNSTRVTSSG